MDRGTTFTTLLLNEDDNLTTGPMRANSTKPNDGTTGSHIRLTVSIGLAQFPVAESLEPYFSPVAISPNIPLFIDLTKMTDDAKGRYFGGTDLDATKRALQHMSVTYDGVIRAIEDVPPNLVVGTHGTSAGRTVAASGLANVPVLSRGITKPKKRVVRFAPVRSSCKIDMPLKRATSSFTPLRQLRRTHHQFSLVVHVFIRWNNGPNIHEDIVVFVYNRFATAFRLDSTISCIFPPACVRLRAIVPGEPVYALVSDPSLKKTSYYEWLEENLKDPFKGHGDACTPEFTENDIHPSNGIIVPLQRFVTDRVFTKQEKHALKRIVTPPFNFI